MKAKDSTCKCDLRVTNRKNGPHPMNTKAPKEPLGASKACESVSCESVISKAHRL